MWFLLRPLAPLYHRASNLSTWCWTELFVTSLLLKTSIHWNPKSFGLIKYLPMKQLISVNCSVLTVKYCHIAVDLWCETSNAASLISAQYWMFGVEFPCIQSVHGALNLFCLIEPLQCHCIAFDARFDSMEKGLMCENPFCTMFYWCEFERWNWFSVGCIVCHGVTVMRRKSVVNKWWRAIKVTKSTMSIAHYILNWMHTSYKIDSVSLECRQGNRNDIQYKNVVYWNFFSASAVFFTTSHIEHAHKSHAI